MWIAKPLRSLSQDEIKLYSKISQKKECPLSQTLTWARAIESQGAEVIVAFNPELQIGGLGFVQQDQIEIINGPIINTESKNLQQEIATFVYALTQARKNLKKILLKPRFPKNISAELIKKINFPVEKIEEAATKILIPQKIEDFLANSSSKFRSEYKHIVEHNPQVTSTHMNNDELDGFYQAQSDFYKTRNIYCPAIDWFKALMIDNPYTDLENIKFTLFKATLDSQISTQLLICSHGEKAYYLFGNEKRTGDAPNISLNLVAQIYALEKSFQNNIKTYDFNGYIVNCETTDVYYGVNQFKKKFEGEVLEYASPEFIFG